MSVFKIPTDWFVDPITQGALKYNAGRLVSQSCTYSKTDGFWDFRPDRSFFPDTDYWEIWDKLQKNGEVSYQNDPENNLGVGKRKDFIDFSNFCNSHGHVLDVGCGPQRHPTHMKYCPNNDVQFIGIDPLTGAKERDFPFVFGVAEYLPFRESLFDQVLFVTTLDHFIDPLRALSEAKRVMKKDGEICVWLGEKQSDAPKPIESHEWYEILKIPDGAEDKFHFKKFTTQDFDIFCQQLDLNIENKEIMEIDPWRKNLFYKMVL